MLIDLKWTPRYNAQRTIHSLAALRVNFIRLWPPLLTEPSPQPWCVRSTWAWYRRLRKPSFLFVFHLFWFSPFTLIPLWLDIRFVISKPIFPCVPPRTPIHSRDFAVLDVILWCLWYRGERRGLAGVNLSQWSVSFSHSLTRIWTSCFLLFSYCPTAIYDDDSVGRVCSRSTNPAVFPLCSAFSLIICVLFVRVRMCVYMRWTGTPSGSCRLCGEISSGNMSHQCLEETKTFRTFHEAVTDSARRFIKQAQWVP